MTPDLLARDVFVWQSSTQKFAFVSYLNTPAQETKILYINTETQDHHSTARAV